MWISYKVYIYISSLLCLPSTPHPTLLGCHRAPGSVPCYSATFYDLFYTWLCIFQCYSPKMSSLSFPHCVHKSILYVCISIPALQIASSVLFFQSPYICVNIQYLFFILHFFYFYDILLFLFFILKQFPFYHTLNLTFTCYISLPALSFLKNFNVFPSFKT